jgi:pyridoxamine 5'-phosphate oxidase-like protein
MASEATNPYELTRDEIRALIDEANGCVVTWARRDGHPAAAYVGHVVLDGEVYVTSREGRSKNVALRRDPRTAWVFEIPGRGGVTVIGHVEFCDDPKLRRRVMEGIAERARLKGAVRETFIRNLDSPGRVVLRIVPERYASRNERTAVSAYSSTTGMPSNYR